ncbi:3-deoxy-8-phosphooctulonate synthase, partial [archaeon]|nr:3-deoxy-8-phosphooctulonate synthase [archaeon]
MRLFAGPCSLESRDICFEVANKIKDTMSWASLIAPNGIDYYFKTSFAKENRSSSTSFMG